MKHTATSARRIAAVRSVGLGESTAVSATADIVALSETIENFDYTARGAVSGLVHFWATGSTSKADWPAVKSGPKGGQTWTHYGLGHDLLTRRVKSALRAAATPEAAPEATEATEAPAETPAESHALTKVERLADITAAVRRALESGCTEEEIMAALAAATA